MNIWNKWKRLKTPVKIGSYIILICFGGAVASFIYHAFIGG